MRLLLLHLIDEQYRLLHSTALSFAAEGRSFTLVMRPKFPIASLGFSPTIASPSRTRARLYPGSASWITLLLILCLPWRGVRCSRGSGGTVTSGTEQNDADGAEVPSFA